MPRNRPRRPVEALAAKMLARIDAQRHRGPGRGAPGRRRTRGTQLAVCSWCGQAYMAKTLRDGGGFCGGPDEIRTFRARRVEARRFFFA